MISATGTMGDGIGGGCSAPMVACSAGVASTWASQVSCSSLTSPWCHPGTLVSRLTTRSPATSYTRSCGSSDSSPKSSREYAARSSWFPMHHTTVAPIRSASGSTRSRSSRYASGSATSARSPVKTSACGVGSIRATRSRAASSRATVSIASYCRASPNSRWMSLTCATTWVGGVSWPYWITSESVRTRRSPSSLAGGLDPAGDVSQGDAPAAGAGGGVAQRHLVAVLEEGAAAAERLLPAPAQLEERAALAGLGTADGARGEQVARACAGAVHGEVGEHLGGGPVHRAVRRPAHDLAVEHHLDLDVERPGVSAAGEVGERLRVLRWQVRPGSRQRRERCHPGTHRGGERLAEERPERHVLPGLDVAGAPVVEADDAEDVLLELVDPDPAAELGPDADDEAELGLDVEPSAGSVRRRVLVRRLALPAGPDDRRTAGHDGAAAAVVADRQVPPVREQRLLVGAEDAADVGGVVERGVEVDVVADGDRKVEQDRVERCRRQGLGLDQRNDLGTSVRPGAGSERHEVVQRRPVELGAHGGDVDDRVFVADTGARFRRLRREHAVRQVVETEILIH